MSTEESKYNYCMDFIKGIACICVIFMHCEFPGLLGRNVQCVSRFAVPFFFMVAGYYCYRQGENCNKEEKLKRAFKKIKNLGVIIVAAVIIYASYAIVMEGMPEITYYNIRNFVLFNYLSIIASPMWFLFALLYDHILYAVVDIFNLHKLAYISIPVFAIVYVCLAQIAYLDGLTIEKMFYRNFLIEGFCFFMLGNFIHLYQSRIKINNMLLIITIIICSLLCIAERDFMGRDFGVNIVTFPQVIAMFLYAVKNPKKFKGNLLQRVGTKLSKFIYLLHPAVWYTMEAVYRKAGIYNNITALYIMPIIVLILTMCLSLIVVRFTEMMKKTKLRGVDNEKIDSPF